jgi:hypothetical protein
MVGRRASVVFRLVLAGVSIVGGIVFNAPEARGHGFGFHITGGLGEHLHRQAGLSWDTAVAEDRLFNYRLNLGYEAFELNEDGGFREKFDGLILENTFGFRLLATEGMRLWGGPQIITGIYEGDIGLGAGLSLGANLHVSESSSVGITLGARSIEYSGFLGGTESESIGYLRLDFFYRSMRDRFRGH